MYLAVIAIGLASPTFWLATLLKQEANKAKVIRLLNWLYFIISGASFFVLLLFEFVWGVRLSGSTEASILCALWSIYLLSRCSEIYIAFLRDALDKVSGKQSDGRGKWWPRAIVRLKNILFNHQWLAKRIDGAPLKNHDRLKLSFRSYFELIINFAILYLLTPIGFWKDCRMPVDVLESGYFSGVTITTLGYGDITPKHWFPQFLTVFEVLCGFALIVVCFAIYLQYDDNS